MMVIRSYMLTLCIAFSPLAFSSATTKGEIDLHAGTSLHCLIASPVSLGGFACEKFYLGAAYRFDEIFRTSMSYESISVWHIFDRDDTGNKYNSDAVNIFSISAGARLLFLDAYLHDRFSTWMTLGLAYGDYRTKRHVSESEAVEKNDKVSGIMPGLETSINNKGKFRPFISIKYFSPFDFSKRALLTYSLGVRVIFI